MIRDLGRKDIVAVRDIALRSWLLAYEHIYKEKTIRRMVAAYYADAAFKKTFSRIKKGKDRFFVALDNDKVVGYAHVSKVKEGWEVLRIYVDPSCMRKGYGSSLLGRVERFLKKGNVKKYIIYPHVKNKIAVNFYKKSGFVRNTSLDRSWNSPCYEKTL